MVGLFYSGRTAGTLIHHETVITEELLKSLGELKGQIHGEKDERTTGSPMEQSPNARTPGSWWVVLIGVIGILVVGFLVSEWFAADSSRVRRPTTGRRITDQIRYPRVLWTLVGPRGKPALGDGHLFTGGNGVYRIDRDGNIGASWGVQKASPREFSAEPSLPKGLVIVREGTRRVIALDRALTGIVWSWTSTTDGSTNAGVLAGGRYVFGHANEVVALNETDGSVAWTFAVSPTDSISMVPAAHNGSVFVGTKEGKFIALDIATGKTSWTHVGKAEFGWTDPIVAFDKVIVGDRGVPYEGLVTMFSSRRGAVNAFDIRTGEPLWSTRFGATGFSNPSATDGHIVGGFGKTAALFDEKTGKIVKRILTGRNPFGSPTVVGETFYFGNLDGHLYAHDIETGELKWAFQAPAGGQVYDFVHTGDRIYLSTSSGLFAIGDDPGTGEPPSGFLLTPE